jgi:hypothetical protein
MITKKAMGGEHDDNPEKEMRDKMKGNSDKGKGGQVGKLKFGAEKKQPKPAAGNTGQSIPRMMKGNKSKAESGGKFGLL